MSYYATAEMKALKPRFVAAFSTFKANEFYITEGSASGEGYHHSREDLIRRFGANGAYSIKHALDKQGDAKAAAAFDLLFGSDAQLFLATKRIYAAAKAKDPRVYMKVREFGGTRDGKNVTAYNITEQRSISFDDSHLWHLHISVHRAYTEDAAVLKGIADVLCGVPLQTEPVAPFKVGDSLETKDASTAYYDTTGKVRAPVAKGYKVVVKKMHLVGSVWWVEGATYFYKANDLKKYVAPAPPAPKVMNKYIVNTGTINVRSSSDTSSSKNVKGVAKSGQKLVGYEVTEGGRTWVIDAAKSYFARQYLLSYVTYVVNAAELNVRKSPDGAIVAKKKKGAFVLVVSTSGGWAKDTSGNYLKLEFLKKV